MNPTQEPIATPRTSNQPMVAADIISDGHRRERYCVEISFAKTLERELTAANAKLAEAERQVKTLSEDWAEDDIEIRKIAAIHGIDVDGDTHHVPPMLDLVLRMSEALTLAQAACARKDEALRSSAMAFNLYAGTHRGKGNADKANANVSLAMACEAALSSDCAQPFLERLAQLEEWKESAMAVENEWDIQAIAKLMGAPLGSSCRKYLAKAIPAMVERLEKADAALDAAGAPYDLAGGHPLSLANRIEWLHTERGLSDARLKAIREALTEQRDAALARVQQLEANLSRIGHEGQMDIAVMRSQQARLQEAEARVKTLESVLLLSAARAWAREFQLHDLEDDQYEILNETDVFRGVEANYKGGVEQFKRDVFQALSTPSEGEGKEAQP